MSIIHTNFVNEPPCLVKVHCNMLLKKEFSIKMNRARNAQPDKFPKLLYNFNVSVSLKIDM